jgi:branched-chain amino acid transport system permease protein
MHNLIEILDYGLVVGSVLALVALGYNLIFGTTRIVNFAQSSLVVVGGYFAFVLIREGFGIWTTAILTIAFTAVIGVVVELVAIRPLGRFDPETNVNWIFTTFAVSLIIPDIIKLTITSAPKEIPDLVHSMFGWRGSVFSNVAIGPNDLLIVGVTLLLMVLLEVMQARTFVGRAIRAVAQDKSTASLMGINTSAIVVLTFAMAGALAAVGAILLAPRVGVNFNNGLVYGIDAFIAAVLGGLGSTRGAVIGGYVLGLTGGIVRVVSSQGANYEQLTVFVIFLIVLTLRPQGLLGQRVVEKV